MGIWSELTINEKRLYVLTMFAYFILIVSSIMYLWYDGELKRQAEEFRNSYNVCNASDRMREHVGLDGIWFQEGFYCVWVKDKDYDNVVETDYHEMCHALVEEDYEHFCGVN